MKIECENGFYRFYPQMIGEVKIWNDTRQTIVDKGEYYTFRNLADFPSHTWQGRMYDLNLLTKNYAGTPWGAMKENGLVYDWRLQQVIPKLAEVRIETLKDGIIQNSPRLPQAGAFVGIKKIKSFVAYWNMSFDYFQIEGLTYESILG